MKTLVTFYSKTGVTKKLATMLSAALDADTEELVDKKKRSGLIGWLYAGRDGMKRIPTEIGPLQHDPSRYDIVLVGGPLWGFKGIAPASRTYLLQNKHALRKVAFFMTSGGRGVCSAALNDLAAVYGSPAVATLAIGQNDLGLPTVQEQIQSFVTTLRQCIGMDPV